MAHEELKRQFNEDVKQYGEDAYKMWEMQNVYDSDDWKTLTAPPIWFSTLHYRRKKPPFQPEYFSGLNWRDALPLVGKVVEFSDNTDEWSNSRLLNHVCEGYAYQKRFEDDGGVRYEYIKTCPETHAHPTITLTVNGRKWVLPKPETEAPKVGTECWLWTPTSGVQKREWCGAYTDEMWLEIGIFHLTESRAQTWAAFWREAILGAVRG